ncbi:hypothetical protein BKI52_06290 [marine bacterium AO1-C]|nr:hypothetical protein BKI52_06290 [marine bacterium AO1-C]
MITACKKDEEQMKTFEQIIAEKACLTCNDFTTQLEAKNYVLTLKPECYAQLSPNQDSVFCPNLPENGAAINYSNCKRCSDFANEAQAKAYANTSPQCRSFLDPNGNGVFCEQGEGSFGTGTTKTCLSCTDFIYREVSQQYFIINDTCLNLLNQNNEVCPQLPQIANTIGQQSVACKTCDDFKWREAVLVYIAYRAECFDAATIADTANFCKQLPSIFD